MALLDKLLKQLRPVGDKQVSLVPGMKYDDFRSERLKELSSYTHRNVIAYYSGFLQGRQGASDINETDMFGFMDVLPELDRSKGLDLILHTPGGYPTTAESIVKYLHAEFGNNIRIIVPEMAMSAGTLISCSASTILMGNYSCLGPIDPQFGIMPAFDMRQELYAAKNDLKKNPDTSAFWQTRLRELPPGFFYWLEDGILLSGMLARNFLVEYMFKGEPDAEEKAERIVKKLNSNNGSHARAFSLEDCRELGLKVENLNTDTKLEILIQNIHTVYTFGFERSNICKIIENQNGTRFMCAEEEMR